MKNMEQIIYGSLLVLGLGFLIFSVHFYLNTKKLLNDGVRTSAEVVENNLVRDTKDGGVMYEPVMRYNANGKMQTMIPNIRSNPPTYKIGEKVAIIYERNNVSNSRVISYWGLHLASIVMMVFALPLIVICGGYLLFKAGIL